MAAIYVEVFANPYIVAEIAQWDAQVFSLLLQVSKPFAYSNVQKSVERGFDLSFGTKVWRDFYFLYRDDGPAIEFADGGRYWHHSRVLQRADGYR